LIALSAARRLRWRGGTAPVWLLASAVLASCPACSADEPLPRSARYGGLRDLIVYPRRADEGGVFFLDRFETTRGDWEVYAAAQRDAVPPPARAPSGPSAALPMSSVTLAEARRYARWRFCRLPRWDEWRYAATGRSAYVYPWGDTFRAAWVNSAELGLAEPTAVGTFESGRDDDGAYDLLGNVGEWTESIAPLWFDLSDGSLAGIAARRLWLLDELEATRRWRALPAPWPCGWWIAAGGADAPRRVAGGHFGAFVQFAVPGAPRGAAAPRSWDRRPGERGDTVGLRLAADPRGLLQALLRERSAPAGAELAEVRAFLRRGEVRAVLRPAWAIERAAGRSDGPLEPILRAELGP
jgi:hypothetical protein